MHIGSRIKEQRLIKGLTQTQLAEELSISLDMVKSLEQGRKKPSIETLEKLMTLFSVSADYLIGLDEHSAAIMEEYRKLPSDKKKIIDDMVRKLMDER